MNPLRLCLLLLLFAAATLRAQQLPAGLEKLTLDAGGTAREALLYTPPAAKEKPSPLVFVWHGHGGGMIQSALSFQLHRHWPEAIVVYPQGLPTPGKLTDPEGKRAGWQNAAGNQNDRDLKFYDALLTKLKADWKVDPRRIYSTGHSNGGAFTYLLWAERGATLAAVAPSAAVMRQVEKLKPLPAMHLAGEKDPLVKYQWQQLMMTAVRRRNGCAPEGQPAGKFATLYPSPGGAPVLTYIHPGDHAFPRDAVPQIVKFLQQHQQAEQK
jgi:polyhydroxybutyrate depolymerase